jgi:hypothetical protein
MRRNVSFAVLLFGAASLLSTGCFALSIGGGDCKTRLECLERRVESLERQSGTSSPAPAPNLSVGSFAPPGEGFK